MDLAIMEDYKTDSEEINNQPEEIQPIQVEAIVDNPQDSETYIKPFVQIFIPPRSKIIPRNVGNTKRRKLR